jgi:hypothetical protein
MATAGLYFWQKNFKLLGVGARFILLHKIK